MKIVKLMLALFLTFAALGLGGTLLHVDEAEAARLGGGRSFGSRPSYQRSAPAPTRQQNIGQNQATPGQAAPMPARSGFGGMMGGLLAGSLLGALFFGGGFQGVNFMDILLVGLLVFLGLKLFARKRSPQPTGGQAQTGGQTQTGGQWDHLKGKSSVNGQTGGNGGYMSAGPKVPEGFDKEDFIKGAKAMFMRLQAAWDKRDFEDLSHFATPGMLAEIRAQAEADQNPGKTEVLLLNASLTGFYAVQDGEIAEVYFDGLLQETKEAGTAQIREIWSFARGNAAGMWMLDGIQQVEGAA